MGKSVVFWRPGGCIGGHKRPHQCGATRTAGLDTEVPLYPGQRPHVRVNKTCRLGTSSWKRFGTTVAVGLTIFVLSVVTIIICFTCSCCYLYKMCCRPRPVVTTTTSTTVVHSPYSQAPSVPPSYPGPTYQGYHAMPPQPGMPAAPYPTQYPPPYPAQPMGPPAYHETMAGGAAMPYPASQPPYNPAYMDPPKAAP
ncbi:protein shisa-5 isoform X3 [Physeter macrocephalus]|uniref:Protein shisa-5 n=1 Tax=Physeter macrocephalus TaxID=9755 RepID=A0A2Y9SMD8_PHYMC|nr:protein shisa-5 isoform X3 [Physeter catodon]|eukprot:XP_023979533.1 protein shisa-5 isoform X2 [Physeter catodon]